MAEYIEREALKSIVRAHSKLAIDAGMYRLDTVDTASDMCGLIDSLPAAEVEPVRHGEWTKTEDDWYSLTTITCSECHEEWCFETEEDVSLLNYRYCPNCGAKMDGAGSARGRKNTSRSRAGRLRKRGYC